MSTEPNKWQQHFKNYLEDIANLDLEMQVSRNFLRAKFELILPDIKNDQKKGIIYSKCLSCGFEACREKEILQPLIISECSVCGISLQVLRVPCSKCGNAVYVRENFDGTCEVCSTEITLDYLVDKYGEFQRPKEYLIDPSDTFCTYCEFPEKSLIRIGDEWLCLNCFYNYNIFSIHPESSDDVF